MRFFLIIITILFGACSNQDLPNKTVEASPAAALSLSADSEVVLAGFCSKENIVRSVDISGNPAPVSFEQIIRLSSSSLQVGFFSDSECTQKISVIKLSPGNSEVKFYFRPEKSEYLTLTTGSVNLRSDTQSKTILSPNASQIRMAGPSQVIAGECSSPILIKTLDYQNQESLTQEKMNISLTGAGTGKFYESSDCSGAPITSTSITENTSSKAIYFKSNKVGSFNLIATAPGPISSRINVSVKPGTPSQLVFITPPQYVEAGACSNSFTVQVQDAFNNPVSLTSDSTISLTGLGINYYTSACQGTPVSEAKILKEQDSLDFYATASSVGELNLQVSGIGSNKIQTLTIVPSKPVKLKLPVLPSSITSGLSFPKISVEVQDQYGNLATSQNKTVQLQAFSDSSCSLLASKSIQGFSQVTSTAGVSSFIAISYQKAEKIYIGARSTGLVQDCSGPININPDFPSKVNISGEPNLSAGQCGAFIISAIDQYGNLSSVDSNTTVTLAGKGTAGSFHLVSDCTDDSASSTIIPLGQKEKIVYFKDPKTEDLDLKVSGLGTIPGTTKLKIIPAPASKLSISNPAAVISGQCSGGFSIKTTDIFGNESPVGSETLASIDSFASTGKFYIDSSCVQSVSLVTFNKNSFSKNLFFKGVKAEDVISIFTAFNSPSSAQFTVSSGQAKKISVSSPASQLVGSGFVNFKAIALDENDNISSNFDKPITIFAYSNATCTNPASFSLNGTITKSAINGVSSFTDTRYTKSEIIYIKASAEGVNSECSSPINVVSSFPTKLVILGPKSIAAGTCSSAFSIKAYDDFDNPVIAFSNYNLELISNGQVSFYSSNDCSGPPITNSILESGTSEKNIYLKSNLAGDVNVSVNNQILNQSFFDLSVTPQAAKKLSFTGPISLSVNECSPVFSIESQDQFGNTSAVLNDSLVILAQSGLGSFYSDSGCTDSISSIKILSGNSSSRFYIKDARAESLVIQGSATDLISSISNVTVGSLAPTKIAISSQNTLLAGTCSGEIKIETKDAFGNLTAVRSTTSVSISSFGNGKFYNSPTCSGSAISSAIIPLNSSSVSIYFKDNIAENLAVGFSALGDSQIKDITIIPGVSSSLAFLTEPKLITAGTCSGSVILQVRDQFGNSTAADSSKTINLSGDNVNFYSSSTCSGLPIRSLVVPTGSESAVFYISSNNTSANSINVSGLGSISQPIVVTASTPAKIGYVQVPITGSPGLNSFTVPILPAVQDQFGNTVTSASNQITITPYIDQFCKVLTTTVFSGIVQKNSISGVASFSNIGYSNAETIYIGSSTPGLSTGCSAAININASNPVKLTLAGPSSLVSGQCSGPFSLSTRDTFDNLATSNSNIQINFTNLGLGASVHDSASCSNGNTNTSLTLQSNTNTKQFYLLPMQATQTTITASSSIGSTSFPISIASAQAYKLIVSGTQNLVRDACMPYSFSLYDQQSNLSSISLNTTLTLAGKSSGNFYSDSDCSSSISTISIPAGTSSVQAFYKNSTLGETTILTGSGVFSISNYQGQGITVVNPLPTNLSVSGLDSIDAGTCNLYTVTLNNDSGIPTTSSISTNVSLSGNGNGFYYSDSQCLNPINNISIPAGTNDYKIYYKNSGAEVVNFIMQSTGMVQGLFSVVVNTGAPANIVFKTQPQLSIVAGATLSPAIEVFYADQYGNKVFNSGNPIVLSLINNVDSSAGPTLYGTTSIEPNLETGIATYSDLNIQKTGVFKIKATGAGINGLSSSITVSNAPASKMVLTQAPSTLTVQNILIPTQPKVEFQDQYNNLAVNYSTAVTYSLVSNSSCTINVGSTSISGNVVNVSAGVQNNSSIKITTAGTYYLKATSGSLTLCISSYSIESQPTLTVTLGSSIISSQGLVNVTFNVANPPVTCSVSSTIGSSFIGSNPCTGYKAGANNTAFPITETLTFFKAFSNETVIKTVTVQPGITISTTYNNYIKNTVIPFIVTGGLAPYTFSYSGPGSIDQAQRTVTPSIGTGNNTASGILSVTDSLGATASKTLSIFHKNCQQIKDNGINISGINRTLLDPTLSPIDVYCEMTQNGGGWTQVFYHEPSTGGYFNNSSEAKNGTNPTDPFGGKYSILDKLSYFKNSDNLFIFKIEWSDSSSGRTRKNIWAQSANPTVDSVNNVYYNIGLDSESLQASPYIFNGIVNIANYNNPFAGIGVSTANNLTEYWLGITSGGFTINYVPSIWELFPDGLAKSVKLYVRETSPFKTETEIKANFPYTPQRANYLVQGNLPTSSVISVTNSNWRPKSCNDILSRGYDVGEDLSYTIQALGSSNLDTVWCRFNSGRGWTYITEDQKDNDYYFGSAGEGRSFLTSCPYNLTYVHLYGWYGSGSRYCNFSSSPGSWTMSNGLCGDPIVNIVKSGYIQWRCY